MLVSFLEPDYAKYRYVFHLIVVAEDEMNSWLACVMNPLLVFIEAQFPTRVSLQCMQTSTTNGQSVQICPPVLPL